MPLTGKVALVTGASRGMGAAIARRLASEGAAVAITYASSGAKAEEIIGQIHAGGGKAIAIQADAADPAAAIRAVQETVTQLGGLDILVNNAGVLAIADIAEFPDEQFERMLSVNVRAVFYTTREAAKHLRNDGRVINIGSINSDSMPFAGGSVYALTKGAVAAFTRGVARDLAPRGITVNNIQPGPIDTEMNPAQGPFAELLKGYMALKHYGSGDDVASLVAFLAGPDAAFITGASLKIDGGFCA